MPDYWKMDRNRDFDQIFRTYYQKMFYHAYGFLHDENSALDVVNDTFEVLWANFPSDAGMSAIAPYLYSIVRRKSIDTLRRRSIHQRFIDRIEPPDSFEEEYDYTDYDLKLEMLRRRIASLPFQTRKAFILCYAEGCTYQQAADALGISINTVKTLLSRARKILRDELMPVKVP